MSKKNLSAKVEHESKNDFENKNDVNIDENNVDIDIDIDEDEEETVDKNKELTKAKRSLKTMSNEDKIAFVANKIYHSDDNNDIRNMTRSAIIHSDYTIGDLTDGLEIYKKLILDDLQNERMNEINHVFMCRVEWDIYKYCKKEQNDYCSYRVLKDNAAYKEGYDFCMAIINNIRTKFGNDMYTIRGIRDNIKTTTNDDKGNPFKTIKKEEKEHRTRRPVSAFKQVFDMISTANIDANMLEDCMDAAKSKEHFGVRMPLLKEVTSGDLNEQRLFKGQKRYSGKILTISGKQYIMTNDIYDKNVEKVKAYLQNM